MDTTTPKLNIPTRTNNPGDLRYVGQQGAVKDPSGFAKFPTPQEGYGALLNDIQGKIKRGPDKTLADFANTYAPPSENNTGQYIANLSNKLGVPPNTTLKDLQPKIGQFAEAIASNEGYQPQTSQPSPVQQSSQGHKPGLMDVLLAGGAAGIGWLGANAKPLAGAALTDAGAGIGALGGPAGSIVGATIGTGLGNSLGLNTNNANQPKTTPTTSGVLPQQPTDTSVIDAENAQDIQRIQDAQKATHALSETLQTTPTGKLLASMPQTQESLGYMAQHGFIPDTSSGVNDFSGAMKQNANSRSELSNGIAQVLDIGKEQAPLEQVRQNAYKNIEKYADVREQPQQRALVDKELATYKEHYGDVVSLGNMERSKREQGQAKGDWQKDTPSRNGHRALYGAFRDTITENTKHKELYNKTMKEEQKSFLADKLMKKMHGKKALEHKGILRGVLKTYGKYVGTYLGDKIGGPIGAIVGTMVGDYLTHKVDKKFGRTFFESDEGKKLMELVGKKSPRAAEMLKKEILSHGNDAEKEAKLALKKQAYQEKKKGIMGDDKKEDWNKPFEDLPNIVWGKDAVSKKKKPVKGLLTIKA